ncbi:MAG: hypothetical protein ACYTF4_17670 [Planctomycetota bacterium]
MRTAVPARTLPLIAGLLVMGASRPVGAEVIDLQIDAPALDRWFYPFNSTPGTQTSASIFGPITDVGTGFDPSFDNRDGQMLIGWDTSAVVPPGLGPAEYSVAGVSVVVTIKSDSTFRYDPTPDPYTTWLPPGQGGQADPDPGRPLELFGVGFRCDYSASTFPENGPYCDACSCFPPNVCRGSRCLYAIDFVGACAPRDVSNNVDGGFDPVPFAVATTDALLPGDLVPADLEMTFEVDLSSSCVRDYFRSALDEGMLDLLIASIFFSAPQQAGTFPKIYCKEDPLVEFGVVSGARLDMTVCTGLQGDADGDCVVGVIDFLDLLAAWGPCPDPCPPSCPTDFDGDCDVGVIDFLILLANWTR